MPWKQHRGFRNRLLAMLFLFFNCVCAAAPVLKLTGENYNDTVSIQIPGPLENEEENRATSAYINHVNHFSVRKQGARHVYSAVSTNSAISLAVSDLPGTYISSTSILPIPGDRAFLFRYTLF